VADQRIEKWTRWINGSIRSDVLTMHLQRDAWRDVSKILDDHGDLPESYWWEFMRDTYAVSQAVAVRRQADTHKDAASLGKLIEEIRDDASRVTREFWVELWDDSDPWMLREAERGWTKHFAGGVGNHLDPSIPATDLDVLTAAAFKVKGYVDQHVAHSDASAVPASVTLTLKDVHEVIDTIGHLFKKYNNLLTASTYVFLVPVIEHDWKAIFREPWIRPGSAD
jgi:HEPN superfamily AbiU2-like protein